MRIVMSALVLGAIVAGMLLATVIARRLAGQLGGEPDYAMQIANRIADGDLSVRVETRAGDSTACCSRCATCASGWPESCRASANRANRS